MLRNNLFLVVVVNDPIIYNLVMTAKHLSSGRNRFHIISLLSAMETINQLKKKSETVFKKCGLPLINLVTTRRKKVGEMKTN